MNLDDAPAPASAASVRGATLAEVAWEVCNKVGGIYQVIRSKAPRMVERWGPRYHLIGPWTDAHAPLEFEERPAPVRMRELLERLATLGVGAHYGEWLVSGSPRVLLLQHDPPPEELARLKYEIWERHGIDLTSDDPLVDKVVAFSHASYVALRELARVEAAAREPRRVLAHFHEWMTGLAIPMLRRDARHVRTVFTTHATLLGRYLASNDPFFYDHLPFIEHEREAQRFNIRAQHQIERASAHGSHVFTTVSQITGEECDKLLGRAPDVIVPNGLNMDRFDVGHEFQTLHARYKEAIHTFVTGHFFPSYPMDLDRTLYFFTSGRFEPTNKGFDLCLEAMARLNAQIKDYELPVNVVLFIVTDRPTRSIDPDVLQSRAVLSELRTVCDEILREVGGELLRRAAAGERVNLDDLVSRYWTLRFRRTQQALSRDGLPPVVTHVLDDERSDPVLNHIRTLGLFNAPDDPVKIVYHPRFIQTVNPLWGIEYEQFVRGCHLGVFPSSYEPWGYTPLECIALGVPAITSDLAGFGRYATERLSDHEDWGLGVLRRRGRSWEDAAADLARRLLAFCRLERRGRIALRNEVESRAELFDWSTLARWYDQAHDRALAIR